MKRLLIKLKNEKGFGGHQELLIVIAIVGIIGAIAIPQLVKHWDRIPWLILLAYGAGIWIIWAGIAGFKKLRKRSRVGIRVWSMKTGETLLKIGGHVTVEHLAFSSDGQQLSSFDNDHTFRTWEMPTGREVVNQEIQGRNDWSSALSPDLKYMAFGLTEGVIHDRATLPLKTYRPSHSHRTIHSWFPGDVTIQSDSGDLIRVKRSSS